MDAEKRDVMGWGAETRKPPHSLPHAGLSLEKRDSGLNDTGKAVIHPSSLPEAPLGLQCA